MFNQNQAEHERAIDFTPFRRTDSTIDTEALFRHLYPGLMESSMRVGLLFLRTLEARQPVTSRQVAMLAVTQAFFLTR